MIETSDGGKIYLREQFLDLFGNAKLPPCFSGRPRIFFVQVALRIPFSLLWKSFFWLFGRPAEVPASIPWSKLPLQARRSTPPVLLLEAKKLATEEVFATMDPRTGKSRRKCRHCQVGCNYQCSSPLTLKRSSFPHFSSSDCTHLRSAAKHPGVVGVREIKLKEVEAGRIGTYCWPRQPQIRGNGLR